MRKLTIVVNCTDRKSAAPADDLRARFLPVGTVSNRFAEWRQRVSGAQPAIRLSDLYQGDAWAQAKALASDVARRGTTVRLLVSSAGLGLRDVSHLAPSYAATFAGGHADSVASDPRHLGEWWRHLKDLPCVVDVADISRESALFVLSESYARAMHDDLSAVAKHGGDHLLIGGWRNIDGMARLPANRELRHSLGGTVSTINLRTARRWMEQRSQPGLHSVEDARRWDRWARQVSRSEDYQRTPKSDQEIREIIRSLAAQQPDLSATRALRSIRDQGIACEQKRFGTLFREVAAANDG